MRPSPMPSAPALADDQVDPVIGRTRVPLSALIEIVLIGGRDPLPGTRRRACFWLAGLVDAGAV